MSPSEPLISVVTPFYNTAPFLAECIESVLAQSYSNFEYILVDNQSNDGSGAIAESYLAKDSRLRLVRTPSFLTQTQNYNFTLRQISPESRYCKMVQSDDWIFPRCLTEMSALAESNRSIGVVSCYDLQGTQVFGTGLYPNETVMSGRKACRDFILNGICMFGSPNTVMYRADLVRERENFFPEGSLHFDTEVVFDLLLNHDFGMVHQVLSYSRLRPDSISGVVSEFDPAALDLLILVKRHGPQLLDEAEYQQTLKRARGWLHGTLVRKSIRGGFTRGTRRDFIRYQQAGLRTVNESIQPALLVKHLGAALVTELLGPLGVLPALKSLGKIAR
jgi:glycosyltransferase involved in cell wall biosynthesis